MNSKEHAQKTPSGNCFICKKPTFQQSKQALQVCEDCTPVVKKYDTTKVIRAYTGSGKNSALIFVCIVRIDKNHMHCLLEIQVNGKIHPPENSAFKSEDEAINAGKAQIQALLGEGVVFKEIETANSTNPTERLRLIAGIKTNRKN
jgi:hypothetical protein